MNKIITLQNSDGVPEISLMVGHVEIETFMFEFKKVWPTATPDQHISHEYWFEHDNEWHCSSKDDPFALPVSVLDWSGWRAQARKQPH